MSEEDFEAMIELSQELPYLEAVRFVRQQTGYGLRQSAEIVDRARANRSAEERQS